MKRQNHCVNCNHYFDGNFCNNCGQKLPKRISWEMLAHEIPYSFLHVDSQIITNFRMMLTKPGVMLNDFIGGKRKKYFPPVIFTIIAVSIFLFAYKYDPNFDIESILTVKGPSKTRLTLISAVEFIKKYFKFYIIIIPIFISWVTYLMFRKSKYNYPEHIVINAFIFSIVLFLLSLLSITDTLAEKYDTISIIQFIISILIIIVYPSICFYKTYNYFYSKRQMVLKIVLTNIFSLLTIFLMFFGSLLIALLYAKLRY